MLILKAKIKKKVINWRELVNSLEPIPKDMKNYCVDHIIPLKYFNFLYLDGSINEFEIRKAWSPANLRIITRKKNSSKAGNICIISYPLRFEYVFDKQPEKAKECKELYNKLRDKHIKIIENESIW